jgi:hypothetical protein
MPASSCGCRCFPPDRSAVVPISDNRQRFGRIIGMAATRTRVAILDARSIVTPRSRVHVIQRSRGGWPVRVVHRETLEKREGAGKAGPRLRPVARLRKKCRRQVPQVQPETRPSLRDSLTAASRSPWCAGLSGHHARNALTRITRDISIGISGPRDLTVRGGPFVGARDPRCNPPRLPLPAPRVVTTAIRPSASRRDAGIEQQIP